MQNGTDAAPAADNRDYSFPNVNRVAIAGKLIQDPPLRWTTRGVPVTNFVIVTSPEAEADLPEGTDRPPCYISIVVWAQQAVQCNKFLRKGSSVMVIGELQSMPNHAPERNYYPVQVNAQWIQYLEKGTVSPDDAEYGNQGQGELDAGR
ncbi:MAG TPA: single-stranded DNA-binding protein [bacterium]|jgi:single-strand DNA-binding protein|nr:single-stranded DNA-binding protein [bacterium]HOY43618.1 single-stranded DNA-binding protein [bacterium]HPG81854.1 single-stranded DNA-binding protein [bacterium]